MVAFCYTFCVPGDGKSWRIGDLNLFTENSTMPLGDLLHYDVVQQSAVGHILAQWIRRPEYRSTLIDVCRTLGLHGFSNFGESADRRLADDLLRSFKSGRLYLLKRRHGAAANRAAEQAIVPERPARAAAAASTTSEKTWIEIHLVDEENRPVGNRQYRLKITDGSERRGTLGSDGILRITGIDPGTCELTFIDIDSAEWRQA